MDERDWHQRNSEYLASSLSWLRLRLDRAARQDRSPAAARRNRWLGTREVEPAPKPADGADLNEAIARAAREREEAAKSDPMPALLLLSHQLQLSPFERDILLLCAAMELDTRTASSCARAQGEPGRPYPTFALALSLFDDPSWEALSAHRPLRYWRLIDINQPNAMPLTQSALRADERIVAYIKGLNALDDRLSAYPSVAGAEPPGGSATLLSPSQQEAVDQILWRWRRSPQAVAQLVGPDFTSKQLVAREAVRALRREMFVIGADALPQPASELEWLVRLWQRESQLLPLALYVEASHDAGGAEAAGFVRLVSRLAQSNCLVLLGIRDPLPRLNAEAFSVDVGKPTLAEQRRIWSEVLPRDPLGSEEDRSEPLADQLASQFHLNLPDIRALSTGLDEPGDSRRRSLRDRIWNACNAHTRPRLDTLAQRLDAKATWDELVLAEEPLALLRQIANQVRRRGRVYQDFGFALRMNRGFGISALFAGESGTGKTMAAEVIANDLRLNLYRIDLSAVVSKYIGETEKNLRRLFDAAEDGGAILFFDEADALFGKRSEVKDSHDRYANIEINYLLQRMEGYGGLAILATNMKSALDQAFMRRLRFVVNFTFPSVAERRAIWEKAFPEPLPKAALDPDRLARLNLTGGNIHSVALNAAFLSAQDELPLSMAHVLDAARMEFRKLNKPINEAELAV